MTEVIIEDIEISAEEQKEENTNSPRTSSIRWDNLAYYVFLALGFLLPVWAWPFGGGASLGMSKSLLFFVLVLSATIFYLIYLLQEGVVKYPKSYAFLSLAAILAVAFVSSIFAEAPMFVAMFGSGGQVGSFFFLLFSAILLLLSTFIFSSEKRILSFFSAVVLSSALVFVLQMIHSVFNVGFGKLLPSRLDNFAGSWSELAIFFGFIALTVTVFLEFFNAKKKLRFFLFGILVMSILSMAVANFTAAWIVLGSLLLIFLVYIFSTLGEARNFARLPLFIILVIMFFVLARPLVGDLIDSAGLNAVEVRPSWGATYEVVSNTWSESVKNLIIGSGPNTFVYDWAKFKPLAVNETAFWSTRFQSGIGLLPSLAATSGALGVLAWLSFLFFILYYGFKSVGHSDRGITKSLLFGSFLGSVYLWTFNIIYSTSNFLFALSFFITGIFFAMLIRSGILEMKSFSFVDKTSVGFVSSLLIVLMLIGSVATFYLFFQKYWAAYSYSKGVAVINIEGDLQKGEELLLKATRFDKQDRFHRSLAELGLVRLSQVLSQDLTQEEMRMQFQNILAFTIQHAQTATTINPVDSLNWNSLGRVYQNIIPFNISGTREVAVNAYEQAFKSSPTDPAPLFSSAQVEVQYGNTEAAKSLLNSALKLKGNYTSALFLLSQLAAQEGDLPNAIRQTEEARLTSPNDIGILFQLGLLYYQSGDYMNAGAVFERAVALNANYSNARYFLGLVYDNLGRTGDAILQFEKIQELNPGNAEVLRILSNLRNGRTALFNISPPGPAPENREEPPIEEEEEN